MTRQKRRKIDGMYAKTRLETERLLAFKPHKTWRF